MESRILNREELVSHGNVEGRKVIAEIMDTALCAADPYFNTKKLVRIEDGKLIFEGKDFEAEGDPNSGPAVFDLNEIDRIYVFAIGKGIQRIAKALEEVLGDYLTGGHVLAKHGDTPIMERLEVTLGGHPVPDKYCVEGCKAIIRKIEEAKLTERDLVITAIGNGVSSLCTLPAEGITLEDVMETTRLMQIEYGVPTHDLNQIRNNIDRLKGGRITRLLEPAKMVHLLGVPITVNDKNGGKGYYGLLQHNRWLHTLSDETTSQDALAVIRHWDTENLVPRSVVDYLENFKPENAVMSYEEFSKIPCRIFGLMPEHMDAITEAMKKAESMGFSTYLLTRNHMCEASQAGTLISNIALANAEGGIFNLPCALFSTGELIVTCGKNPGIGGRNQEYCLAAAKVIRGSKRIVVASADTDGTDGPGGDFHPEATKKGIRNLTGGIVDGCTMAEAEAKGLNLQALLAAHSTSYPLWELDSGIAATQNISINDITCTLIFDRDL